MVPPPDAFVGRHGPRASGCCQSCIGFSNSLPIGPPPIADRITASGCDMGAGDNLVRGATAGVQSQPAIKHCYGVVQDVVMHENINLCSRTQYKPLTLPGSLLVASSTMHLLRLPVRVHRACGAKDQCLESCSCLDSTS